MAQDDSDRFAERLKRLAEHHVVIKICLCTELQELAIPDFTKDFYDSVRIESY